MDVKPGDKARMYETRSGRQVDVFVVEVQLNGKVVVEADRSQGPVRQWITGAGYLSPLDARAGNV